MIITSNQNSTNGTAKLILDGRFDAHEVHPFRETCDKLEAAGIYNITIDLADVEFIDSTALAELVRGMKRARERNSDLILANLSNPVQVILELTRLDSAFTIV